MHRFIRPLVRFAFLLTLLGGTSHCFGQPYSAPFLAEKLAGASKRSWRICGQLAERVPGDKQYVFLRTTHQLQLQTCDQRLLWVTERYYHWEIAREDANSPTGWQHYLLLIDGRYAHFRFSNDFKTLYLQLPNESAKICLH